jgi:hypothetical protein
LSIHEEEARMKIGSHLFAILAIGALSTQFAAAGHHGHRVGAAAGHSGTDVITKSAKTGPATDTTTTTPGPGTGSKTGDAAVDDIDTSITVHQGREPPKGSKGRLVKKTKATTPPGVAVKHEPVHNLHQVSPAGSGGGPHRNAVGTTVVKHEKAASPNVAAPGAGATLHEPDKKTAVGNPPLKNSGPGETPAGDHNSANAAALKTVTANGLGISGTGATRPGTGAVALGGPAKATTGVLSGNSFRPRH